jgi:thiol-disulfide isomerase/thioredoxin
MQSSNVKIVVGILIVLICAFGAYKYSLKGKLDPNKTIDATKTLKKSSATAKARMGQDIPWAPKQNLFTEYQEPRNISEVTFYTNGDRPVQFKMWKKRKLVVNLWATWCAPCVAELASLDRLKGKIDSKGYDVLAISIDRRKSVKNINDYLNKLKINNLVTFFDLDRDLVRNVKFSSLPVTLILDEQGREIARYTGPLDWDKKEVIEALSKL